jgi:hypothetical protein
MPPFKKKLTSGRPEPAVFAGRVEVYARRHALLDRRTGQRAAGSQSWARLSG